MSKDPAFLFYPGDYLRDTQCLSEKTQVAYDRIMCEHMRNICISKTQLKFFTKRLSDEEMEELQMVLTETKQGFQISWVAESIEKRKKYSESRRNNRKGKPKNISKTYDSHMENEDVNENEIKDSSKNEIEKAKKELPDFVQEFIEHRKSIKKPFKTKLQVEKWVQKLNSLSKGNEALARKIIDNSIANGWQGIFELERSNGDTRIHVDEAIENIKSGKTKQKTEWEWNNPKQINQ